MAISNSIENFKMEKNEKFISKVNSLNTYIYKNYQTAKKIVEFKKSENDYIVDKEENIINLSKIKLSKGNKICIDFGNHYVGYFSFTLSSVGSPADAPAYLLLKFAEHICEIAEDSSDYNGDISSSWIQEERIHVDMIPSVVNLPRRYAFRYVEITVLDTSPKYSVVIDNPICETVSSGNKESVENVIIEDNELKRIDEVSLKTMEDCMQEVFEDGPKRDRRLWLGDLRLQALTNYETFHNNDLVKKCLYLFAGLTQNEGRVGACLFHKPNLLVDDTSLFDYSLFFVSCLHDYYVHTEDRETLLELWDTAYKQIELSYKELDNRGVVIDKETWWCFVDWHDELNKQASAQAIFIYTLKQALYLSEVLNDKHRKNIIHEVLNRTIEGAKQYLWDNDLKFFISGKNKQVSWASQVWFVLADILSLEENIDLLKRLKIKNPDIRMITPYMNHHYVDALVQCQMLEEAKTYIKYYWGGMVKENADCFWELFDPENKYVSPYGSRIINSYCHAWSCTPSLFIRKYFTKK